jgi:predicted lipoprotein with Yx(FWY)xxD motif
MTSRSGLAVLALFAAVLVAAWAYRPPAEHHHRGADAVPPATPPGITLRLRTLEDRRAAKQILYADAHGMTLYARDADGADSSRDASHADSGPVAPGCAGDCAPEWPPALAPAGASADGDWSLIARDDGSRQWAYRGRPLHRYAGDSKVGESGGDGADGGRWHVALYRPASGLALPDAVGVHDVGDAGGAVLTDGSGMTLYELDAPGSRRPPDCLGRDCTREWAPLEAPEIAVPTGDFATLSREDGITQWTFRGRPLYTYRGDLKPEDANGAGIDPRFRPALVLRFFMPGGAEIRRNITLGAILATAAGATLYQRDLVINEERHEFRSDHGSPALGRSLGTAACDRECTHEWPPFRAPRDAVPGGYWDVLTRADGSLQWAYKGFALYTYAKDEPGQISGHEIHTLGEVVDDSGLGPARERRGDAISANPADTYVPAGGAAAGLGISAMFWHAVAP